LTDQESWQFCPGKENPADLPSHSCGAMDIINQTWWSEPSILQLRSENCPDLPTNFDVESANAELARTPQQLFTP